MANYCYSTPQEQQFFQLQTINNNENMDIITDVYQSSVFYVDEKMFLSTCLYLIILSVLLPYYVINCQNQFTDFCQNQFTDLVILPHSGPA